MNLTSKQRRDIRAGLIAVGFTRTSSSADRGNGEYREVWTLGTNSVMLTWAPRAQPAMPHCPHCGAPGAWTRHEQLADHLIKAHRYANDPYGEDTAQTNAWDAFHAAGLSPRPIC